MMLLKFIISDKGQETFFTVTQLAEALRISRQAVGEQLDKGYIQYDWANNKRVMKGAWIKKYLIMREEKGGKFKSLKEILKDYELPAQRDE